MKWYLRCLDKYADFNGRARRTEYWMFYLFYMIFAFVIALIDAMLGLNALLYLFYILAMLLPFLSVSVRRLHDTGNSGWMLFIGLIPLIGPIWMLVLMVTDGDRSSNTYGPNPKLEII